jgi:PAS domain S-box-containing protein
MPTPSNGDPSRVEKMATQLIEEPEATDRNRRPRPTLLIVDGDRSTAAIERSARSDEAEIVVETVTALAEAWERLDGVDCLVITSTAPTEPDTAEAAGDAAETDVAELDSRLEAIRTNAPELPTVVLADERTAELVRTVRSYDLTAVLEGTERVDRLADHVHDLLERRRLAALSRRSLASIEFAGDAIAVVDPDDEVQFASRSFAMQFGYDHDAVAGTPWRELFTDGAVDHLESAAIPAVGEGWRWTGTCTGRRRTGSTFSARVRLGGLEDGSLVFVVDESEGNEPDN